MKNLLLSAAALTLLFTASCSKSDDGPGNSWSVNGVTYGTVIGTSQFGSVSATNVNTSTGYPYNTILFDFNGSTAPTAGTYKVVAADQVDANDEVSFSAQNATSQTDTKTYNSTGEGDVKVTVTVNGGKVSISMPTAKAQLVGGTDKVDVTANISQTL